MSRIDVQVRLRPVRFAFLVQPDDRKRTLEIFRLTTSLWGGKFNPIVPCFNEVPLWWDRHDHRLETAAQIVNGYLDFFEPDFIVEAEPGLADGLGFDKERVLDLSGLLMRKGDRAREGHGQSVLNLYQDLYHKEYQFTRRHEHNIIQVTAKEAAFAEFCACIFGAFPTDVDHEYLNRAFRDAFEPKEVLLDGAALANLYKSGCTSALRLGSSKIEVQYHDHSDPAIFILDAEQSRDLIDFWNLRAISGNVVPVPVQWLKDLSEFCKEFMVKNYRPLPGNSHGVMIHPTVMFARSIPTADIERLHAEYLHVDTAGANLRQDWYPAIWHPSPSFTFRLMRPTLSVEEKTYHIPFVAEKPDIRFDCLVPEFAEQYGNQHRWANVVRLRDWTFKNQIARAYPCNYKDPKFIKFGLGAESILSSTEGFVIFPRYKNIPEQWKIQDGATAIKDWLKTHGITAVLSDAGRVTQQIIQTVGGFHGVDSFAHANIVKLLNEISRRPISRSAHHKEFQNRIQSATKEDNWRRNNFESLVERNAVELGLELKCSKCSSWSWYSLKQLDYQVTCSLCLRQFGFPILDPSSNSYSKWAYRLIGPFALPNFANGGYAASLSIRFFAEIVGSGHDNEVTWSPGQELELALHDKVEADFILWYQRKEFFGNDYPTELVFGEAKSFGGENRGERDAIKDAFQDSDTARLKKLAVRFPGSILVFATMKQATELSTDEITRIATLAEWGREYISERRQSRAPVIVLTGTELFASYSIHEAWEKVGGRHAEIAKSGWIRTENLRVLADLTQQLYLHMPSYSEWLEEKWRK
jgi:hypothetical protein